MARELDAILDHGETTHATSCISEDGSVSFLDQIIRPIYKTLQKVSAFVGYLPLTVFTLLACLTSETHYAQYQKNLMDLFCLVHNDFLLH